MLQPRCGNQDNVYGCMLRTERNSINVAINVSENNEKHAYDILVTDKHLKKIHVINSDKLLEKQVWG